MFCIAIAFGLAGCVTPNLPQRSFQWGHHLEAVGLTTRDDIQKNAIARAFVDALVSETNPSLVTSVTVDNPRRWDFSAVVKEFSERAAVPFTNSSANLVVKYEVSRVDGAWRGGNIRNFQMVVSVIRPQSILGGDQIIAMRSVRLRCSAQLERPLSASCSTMVPLVAEGLLYELAASYYSKHE